MVFFCDFEILIYFYGCNGKIIYHQQLRSHWFFCRKGKFYIWCTTRNYISDIEWILIEIFVICVRHTFLNNNRMKFLAESSERHSRRQYVKRSQVPEMISSPVDSCRQMPSLRRKHIDSKPGTQYGITKNLSKTYSSSVMPATNTKRSILQQSRYMQ